MLLGLPEFQLLRAHTLESACTLLDECRGDIAVLAGGTDLLAKMKQRRFVPRRVLDIKKIPGLDQVVEDERRGLRIGALTTIHAIEASMVVARRFPSLQQAAAVMGTTQIRNTGTVGGNLANASPSAEFAPPLLALGASVRCVGRDAERSVPLDDWFAGPGKTTLRDDELLTEVRIPAPPDGARGIYLKHSLRRMDVAIASAAVLIVLEGQVCRDVRIALGAVGPVPFRARKAEDFLRGKRLAAECSEEDALEETARIASGESFPIDDLRAYAGYRRKLVAMLVAKGLQRLVGRTRPSWGK